MLKHLIVDKTVRCLSDLSSLKGKSGVYCLEIFDRFVYVGASSDLQKRLRRFFTKPSDRHNKKLERLLLPFWESGTLKPLVHIRFVEDGEFSDLIDLELLWITTIKPTHNYGLLSYQNVVTTMSRRKMI